MTADQAVASLLVAPPLQIAQPVYDDPATTTVENTTWINPPGQTLPAEDFVLRRYVMGWWVNEALHDPGISHRLMFFLHQHMIVTSNTYGNAHFFDYLSLLRWASLGNFKKLATKMVADNTMLIYLNNQQNVKTNPNENFAREFLELFTIGKGPQIGDGDYTNYTEQDIEQAARVFTGFRVRNNRDQIDPETGIPRGITSITQHDTGSKTFSSKFNGTTIAGATTAAGMWTELDSFVNMVFAQPEVARNFCRRLYRWFVNRHITPEIETDIIEPLATTFRTGNYEIKPVVQQLLQSQHFFDADDSNNADEIVGGMIKSPLEMTLQMVSFFGLTIPSPTANPRAHYENLYSTGIIQRLLLPAGLPIFSSSDVAGYPGYYQEPEYSRQWFNSSTIIPRYKFPQQLLTGKMNHGSTPTANIFLQLNFVTWVRNSGFFSDPSDPYALVQELIEYLLPETLDGDRFNYFYNDVFLDNLPPADWTYEWQNYLSTNNLTEVKIPLERLLNAIMYSPEFQTF